MKMPKKEMPTSSGQGGTVFLKLKDGESAIGVFRGDVFEFYSKWDNGKSKVVSANDPEGKSRFRLNFITLVEGVFRAKIWEFGLTIYNQLSEINEEYPLEKNRVKITRRGVGTDTTYTILPMLKEPIPAKTLKEIEAVELNILDPKSSLQNYAPSADEIGL